MKRILMMAIQMFSVIAVSITILKRVRFISGRDTMILRLEDLLVGMALVVNKAIH